MNKSFTFNGYRSLLTCGLNMGYKFLPISKMSFENGAQFCLLRHDIDVSLELAYKMSEIEKEMGIVSTYFLMLRSPVYNLFSRSNSNFVKKIIDNGHNIGLHYDEGYYNDDRPFGELIDLEVDVLTNFFKVEIEAVSFHQPGKMILEGNLSLDKYLNTYNRETFKGIHYISDSNKIWKEEDPWQIFLEKKYNRIQLLIHPIWWISELDLPTKVLWDLVLKKNFELSQNQILETERAFGKKRKFDIKDV